MGKNLIQQARGRGGPTYRAPSFRYEGKPGHLPANQMSATVIDFIHCPGHSAPLVNVKCEDRTEKLMIAPEGIAVGEVIQSSNDAPLKTGNTMPLSAIAEGTLVYNLELTPGDGGKFVRASGTFAKVIGKRGELILVQLPSKKTREFSGKCRATVGIVAGAGRSEKPILKAGTMFHKMKARNKLYPIMSGSAQNAVDHPFGNKRTSRKSKARPVSRNAPPGRKVGMIAASRTGRRKK